jgi:hypothetical protein
LEKLSVDGANRSRHRFCSGVGVEFPRFGVCVSCWKRILDGTGGCAMV